MAELAPAAAGNATRSAALEFLTVDTRGQQLVKSGMLADVRITPDPRTNTLLVSALPKAWISWRL